MYCDRLARSNIKVTNSISCKDENENVEKIVQSENIQAQEKVTRIVFENPVHGPV